MVKSLLPYAVAARNELTTYNMVRSNFKTLELARAFAISYKGIQSLRAKIDRRPVPDVAIFHLIEVVGADDSVENPLPPQTNQPEGDK